MGNILNDVLGVSSSAKQQYKNQMKLQKDAQNFSKWQMANAHQMEVQDLQKAGLNPVLSAGGSGASAGVSEGGASTGSTAGDPVSMINAIVGMINNSKQTEANVKKVKADITNETNKTNAEIRNIDTDTILKGLDIPEATNKSNSAKTWWGRNIRPYIDDAKGIGGVVGSIINPIAAFSGAKRVAKAFNSPKTTVTNHYNSKGKFTGSTTTTSRK